MSETPVWLIYLISGGLAFALVRIRGWMITPAIVSATVLSLLFWVPLHLLTPRDEANYWFQVELALNASFCAIFAGVGAAIAFALRSSGR